ncbi:hypothetical protein QVD17_37755 [Tagetes erecta]|uniref:Uncharacterized protein n=1 Tax=Tagetes erecta TaxID=13708 RepID=A0AAD8JWY6_TARER|nr:hypothetical protein QVD17_37755 [Tagetes erecta]
MMNTCNQDIEKMISDFQKTLVVMMKQHEQAMSRHKQSMKIRDQVMMTQRLYSIEMDLKHTFTAPSKPPPPPTPKLTSKIPPPMWRAPAAAPKTTPNQPPTQPNPKLKWKPTTAPVLIPTTTASTVPNILKLIVKLMFGKEELKSFISSSFLTDLTLSERLTTIEAMLKLVLQNLSSSS